MLRPPGKINNPPSPNFKYNGTILLGAGLINRRFSHSVHNRFILHRFKQILNKLGEKTKLFGIAWSVGLGGGLLFWLLRITRRVKVQGYDRKKLDPKNKGLILIHNHPSLWEPALLPFLFFPWYLFSSRFLPFSIPDKKNYHDKRWFSPFRAVCIPVERENPRQGVQSLRLMKEKLAQDKVLILAPEGGRTFKGEEFKVAKDGKTEEVKGLSEIDLRNNKVLRRFKPGVGWLVSNSKVEILPVWTEGGEGITPNGFSSFKLPFPRLWKQTRIKIGERLDLEKLPRKEIVGLLEDSVLRIGDRV
jgi:1-acyl-sn-glycerol-3-phosphate acyltransferase